MDNEGTKTYIDMYSFSPGVFLGQSIRSWTSNGESNGEWKSLGLKTIVVALNPLDAKLRFKTWRNS